MTAPSSPKKNLRSPPLDPSSSPKMAARCGCGLRRRGRGGGLLLTANLLLVVGAFWAGTIFKDSSAAENKPPGVHKGEPSPSTTPQFTNAVLRSTQQQYDASSSQLRAAAGVAPSPARSNHQPPPPPPTPKPAEARLLDEYKRQVKQLQVELRQVHNQHQREVSTLPSSGSTLGLSSLQLTTDSLAFDMPRTKRVVTVCDGRRSSRSAPMSAATLAPPILSVPFGPFPSQTLVAIFSSTRASPPGPTLHTRL